MTAHGMVAGLPRVPVEGRVHETKARVYGEHRVGTETCWTANRERQSDYICPTVIWRQP